MNKLVVDMFSIAVEIEHKKYAQLIRSDGPSTGRLDLTTLVDFQKRAVVRLFLFRSNKPKILIKEIALDGLPHRHAGDIRIVLTGELKGSKRLALTLSYGGQTLHSGVVSLKGHLRSKAVWLLLPAALVAAGIILFVTFSPPKTPPEGAPGKPEAAEETAAEETAADEVEAVEREPAEEEPAEEEAAGPEEAEAEQTRESTGEMTVETGEGEAPSREAPPEEPPAAEPVTETVTVYFEPNRSRLIDEARETLGALLSLLEEFEELSVRIEGHCALRGSESGRIELSDERSAAVRRYLRDAGWVPDSAVEVEGFGGRRPATLSEEDQYLNRRVEITVTYIP